MAPVHRRRCTAGRADRWLTQQLALLCCTPSALLTSLVCTPSPSLSRYMIVGAVCALVCLKCNHWHHTDRSAHAHAGAHLSCGRVRELALALVQGDDDVSGQGRDAAEEVAAALVAAVLDPLPQQGAQSGSASEVPSCSAALSCSAVCDQQTLHSSKGILHLQASR